MVCSSCQKEVVADRVFCSWCEAFIPNPRVGQKAGLFRRWVATVIDPLIGIALVLIVGGLIGGGSRSAEAGIGAVVLVLIAYGIFYLWLLSRGMTPGKWVLNERVITKQTGAQPGLGVMLLREIIGKFVSGLFLGLGYFWAIWDKDQQAWHDKIAGTVVVRQGGGTS